MNNSKRILTIVFGLFIAFNGIVHFVNPAMYLPFFPDFVPPTLVTVINYGAGVAELVVAACVFIPQYRSLGTLGILLLMVAFLPLHVADIFKKHPAIGTHQMALIRLPLQFVLIGWAWFIHKK